MKIGSVDINAVLKKSRKTRRLGLMVAFYAVLGLLLLSIVSSYMVTSNPISQLTMMIGMICRHSVLI